MNHISNKRFWQTVLVLGIASSAGPLSFQPPRSAASEFAENVPDQKVQPVENSLFIDQLVRCRVTRKFEIYNPHSPEQLREIKNMGFTQVILDWPNLHAEATELGLDVVLANWWTLWSPDQSIDEGVNQAKQVNRKRLAAVSMMDEPERNSPGTPFTYYQALYEELRDRFDRELPGVPLEISHWGPLRSWTPQRYQEFVPLYQSADHIRIMPYPDLHEGPLDDVYFQMMRSRHVMKLANRNLPQIVILQTWQLPENPKLPTIDELRVMAYQALLSGADTISFFSYDPDIWTRTPGFTEGFAELMRELTQFSRRFQMAQVETQMNSEGILKATLSMPGANQVTVVVNTNREPKQGFQALQVIVPAGEPQFHQSNDSQPTRGGRILRRLQLRRHSRGH